MNIKKYSLKTMCAALACTTVLSSTLAAYATDVIINETPMDDSAGINALSDDSSGTGSGDSGWTTEENSVEDIKVTYQQPSSYTVTIPKTIALDTNRQAAYSVKVSGDIDDNQRVYVAPVDGIADSENLDFYMKDLSNKKAEVVATVTQNKTYWNSEDVTAAYEETNNSVSAPNLTAGTWEGIFQMQIKLETQVTHKHNYVETITKEPTCTETGEKTYTCDCGDSYAETIPAIGHHYENGECTECGEKYKSYSVYGMGYQCTGSSFYNVYYSRHSTYYTNVCYEVPASDLVDSMSLCFTLSSSTTNLEGWLYYSPSRIPMINNTGTSVKMQNWPSGSYRVFDHERVKDVSTLVLTQPSYESTGYYYIFIEGPGTSNSGVSKGSVFVTYK